MIMPFVITVINDVLSRLEHEGYDFEQWNMRRIRKYAGLSYQYIYNLERKGIIDFISRDSKGHLFWTHVQAYKMLMDIKWYLLKKER